MRKLIILSLVFLSVSCSDFLDKEPLDQITQGNFYKTASDANLATISMYSVTGSINWFGLSWMITEIPTDNTTVGGNDPDFSPIDNFTISADNSPNTQYWQQHYKLITLANQVLTYVPGIEMDEEIKSGYLAEAYFMRAFSYFDLVRIYGDVPIVTTLPELGQDLLIPRSPVSEVYQLIIDDLLFATENLPDTRPSSDMGRATSYAAKAILSKVYLTTGEYDKSITLCTDIINSNQYKLVPVADNWLRDVSDNNAEAIWQVQYVGCGPLGTGNALQAFFAPWGQGITQNSDGWGSQIPTAPTIDNPGTTIKDAFKSEDLRKYHSIMTAGDEYPMINPSEGGYKYPSQGASRAQVNIKKYVIGGGNDVCFMSTPQNYHVIRYADVLLMLAEASCKRNGGLSVTPEVVSAFNQVRERAGLSKEEVITTEMVYKERRLEFAFENHRWFDLLREGNIQKTMQLHGKQMQDHNILFPIPTQELAINPNLTQNEGY
ncbi:RagB/SusD family nutrient uptake outer membrane protein [Portibacter lacus]|uniref:Membrane protein n=1 Tax=Portibacter lacus TaxID=1099794 RepID=A0AA37SU49_9BACT|nr:RagB/SusD family nutrient uptake outer membrane protein [Portibacter lacus]GLR18198.1 membrane protein [Portibacter lacus]